MEDGLIMSRETVEISGGRQLHSYRFRDATPLDRLLEIAQNGELGVIPAFLDEHPNLDPAATGYPWTPLHLAAKNGDVEAIRTLLARGAPLDRPDDWHDSTPLGWAAFFGQPEAAQVLLSAGASVTENALQNARDGIAGTLPPPASASPNEYLKVLELLEAAKQ